MTRIAPYDPTVHAQALEALEPLVIGSVAITARALAASGVDLSFLQWRAVLIVGEADQGATVSEIASRIGANLSPTSRLIGRLAGRGLVQTDSDPEDRRATRVTLTLGGRALRSRVLAYRREALRLVLADASLTPGEEAILERLARSFRRFT